MSFEQMPVSGLGENKTETKIDTLTEFSNAEGVLRNLAEKSWAKKLMIALVALTGAAMLNMATPKNAEARERGIFSDAINIIRGPLEEEVEANDTYGKLIERDEKMEGRAEYMEGKADEEKFIAENGHPSCRSDIFPRDRNKLNFYQKGRLSVIKSWEREKKANERRIIKERGKVRGMERYKEYRRGQ